MFKAEKEMFNIAKSTKKKNEKKNVGMVQRKYLGFLGFFFLRAFVVVVVIVQQRTYMYIVVIVRVCYRIFESNR